MTAEAGKLYFIGLVGDVGEGNISSARKEILGEAPGALPELIEVGQLLDEVERNRAFMGKVVILSNERLIRGAEAVGNKVREMGLENVQVLRCA